MTIDEAIKNLEEFADFQWTPFQFKVRDAIKLGFEALKREVNYRMAHPDVAPYLLPGETEDLS